MTLQFRNAQHEEFKVILDASKARRDSTGKISYPARVIESASKKAQHDPDGKIAEHTPTEEEHRQMHKDLLKERNERKDDQSKPSELTDEEREELQADEDDDDESLSVKEQLEILQRELQQFKEEVEDEQFEDDKKQEEFEASFHAPIKKAQYDPSSRSINQAQRDAPNKEFGNLILSIREGKPYTNQSSTDGKPFTKYRFNQASVKSTKSLDKLIMEMREQ